MLYLTPKYLYNILHFAHIKNTTLSACPRRVFLYLSDRCNSCFNAVCNTDDTFKPVLSASAFSHDGSDTFLRTVRIAFLRRYSAKLMDTILRKQHGVIRFQRIKHTYRGNKCLCNLHIVKSRILAITILFNNSILCYNFTNHDTMKVRYEKQSLEYINQHYIVCLCPFLIRSTDLTLLSCPCFCIVSCGMR